MTFGGPLGAGEVLVSGIKPTGTPHLGNLVGMLKPAARLAQGMTSYLFVADLHALTTIRSREDLSRHVYDDVAVLLALGVDPERTVVFRQSDVPQILEVAWTLACLAPMALLERAHAFKAATSEGASPTLGLFSYPVLMAADILALGGTLVPVGADQQQHVELTRDLARRFNHAFGGALPLPRATVESADIPGLDGRKMSKRYNNTIPINATPAERRSLVRGIVTDSSPLGTPLDAEASTVIQMLRHFEREESVRELTESLSAGRVGWAEAKNRLADALDRDVEPLRQRFAALRGDERHLEAVLQHGAARARAEAASTVAAMKASTGAGPAGQDDGATTINQQLDDALGMTFPASDPVAISWIRSAPAMRNRRGA